MFHFHHVPLQSDLMSVSDIGCMTEPHIWSCTYKTVRSTVFNRVDLLMLSGFFVEQGQKINLSYS